VPMLEKRMDNPMTINDTIESYRKRRNRLTPLILGGLAILLVIIGGIILVTSLRGGGLAKFIATKTPTPTLTPVPTDTPTVTNTPTVTLTPTVTSTATQSAIYDYVVKEGDTLTSIVKDQNLGDNGLNLIYLLNPTIDPLTGAITVGQTIKLPPPNYPMPTSSPIPTGLAPGTRINYTVMPGDSLGSIANKFLSTPDQIVLANKTLLKDGTSTVIQPGWVLVVPINLVTAVPTKAITPTFTPTATTTP
jgi:type VI secretion system secreted protein VgrG